MKLYWRYIVASGIIIILIIITTGLINKPKQKTSDSTTPKDTLSVAIGFKRSIFNSSGYTIGFHYELLRQLAKDLDKELQMLPPFSTKNHWELLLGEQIDIIVVDISDSIPKKYSEQILQSISPEGYAFVINKADKNFLKSIDLWKSSYIIKPEYKKLKHKYFRSYHISSHLNDHTQTKFISPYDNKIKKYSKLIGWDWKLLAALIHQESRFSFSVKSSRGAIGLMQIKPSTAKIYGITELLDPENNIKAGSLHLKRLKKRYIRKGMDSINVIKFTLAAYNAGESRIRDCMNITKAQNNNPLDWEEVVKTIPLMSMPEHYTKANLRHGKFKGTETIKYVQNILSKYEDYKLVIKD